MENKGYRNHPITIVIEGKIYSLRQKLFHATSGNEYEIKEIQAKGFMTELSNSPIRELIGTRAYLPYAKIQEYR